jgi:magnesium-transporting ATPase (P-type)
VGCFSDKRWDAIRVGDIIQVKNREQLPVDCLILCVNEETPDHPTGVCYVETKSLDGETNLKTRSAMETTTNHFWKNGATSESEQNELLSKLDMQVQCETPNANVNGFDGDLKTPDGDEHIPFLSMLLRGCVLRQTPWVSSSEWCLLLQ